MRPKVSDRIPTLSRGRRSRLRRSAAGTIAATAVRNSGRGMPRASQRTNARKRSGASPGHVPLLDPKGEPGRVDPNLGHEEDERRRCNGDERALGRRRRAPERCEADEHDQCADWDHRNRQRELSEMIDDPVERIRGVVLDLEHSAVGSEAGLQSRALRSLVRDVHGAANQAGECGRPEARELACPPDAVLAGPSGARRSKASFKASAAR